MARAVADGRIGEWLQAAGIENVHVAVRWTPRARFARNDSVAGPRRGPLNGAGVSSTPSDGGGPTTTCGAPAVRSIVPRGSTTAVVDAYPFEENSAIFLADFEGPMAELSPGSIRQDGRSGCRSGASLRGRMGVRVHRLCACTRPRIRRTAHGADHARQPVLVVADHGHGCRGHRRMGRHPVRRGCAHRPCAAPSWVLVASNWRLSTGRQCAAADDAALAKIFTRAYFAEHSLVATFMAQVSDGFPGLGGHPSLSFRSSRRESGADRTGRQPLEDGILAAIAGDHRAPAGTAGHGGAVPQLVPALRSGELGALDRHLGHRELQLCPARGVPTDPESARLELRVPGSDTGPHLCTAMVLGAAAWGIEHGLEPPPPVPRTSGRSGADCGRLLPRDLVEAAAALLGEHRRRARCSEPSFVAHYAAGRIAEAQACHRFVSDAGTPSLPAQRRERREANA